MREGQRGTIALELAIAVPFLVLLVCGGITVAQAASAKASLQMTAMRAARELAASEAADRISQANHLYAYEEFTETYGLPRSKVKMLVAKQGSIIVTGACYRVRLAFGKPDPVPLPEELQLISDIAPAQVSDKINILWQRSQVAKNEIGEVSDQAKSLWDSIQGLGSFDFENRAEFIDQNKSFSTLQEFDQATKARCGNRNLLVTARSAFWSEQSTGRQLASPTTPQNGYGQSTKPPAPPKQEQPPDQPPEPDEPDRDPTLTLYIDPTQVTLYRDTNPNTLPIVRAVAMATPAGTACKITVRYTSGPSQSKLLKEPYVTDDGVEGTIFEWRWRVGSTTKERTYPVTVNCSNGRSATVELTVLRSNDPTPRP